MEYIGVIVFSQIIQFFQNFRSIYQFYLSLLMCSRQEFQSSNSNFTDVINCCKFFSKFSNGVTLFVLKVLVFVILVDAFNINVVSSIVVIDPYYILYHIDSGTQALTVLGIVEGAVQTLH